MPTRELPLIQSVLSGNIQQEKRHTLTWPGSLEANPKSYKNKDNCLLILIIIRERRNIIVVCNLKLKDLMNLYYM